MKVTAENLPERQVRLQIEVDDERHSQAIEAAYKKLAPRVRIPGFRPGKAPRPMIEKELGRHRLLDEAMDIVIPEAYKEALQEQELNPVASPSVELVSHEPLVFTATVPLPPTIDLGDYLSMRLPREPVTVTDEQVEATITDLRRRYGTIEPVERPAQKGDVISGSLSASVDGEQLFEQNDIEYRLTDESLAQLPGLADAIVGLRKGDVAEKTGEGPADFEDARIAGKTVTYKITVNEVKEEKLADADDAFAKQVGEGFETLQDLRIRIREDTQKAEEDQALRLYETEAMNALTQSAVLEYPGVLLEHEIDHILDEQANLDPRDPRAQDMYLQRLGKSEAEVRDLVHDEAEQRLRRSLVLSNFAEAENIQVEDSDIDAELQTMAESAGEQGAVILQLFGSENGRDTLRRSLLTRKTLARLVEIASSGQPEGTVTTSKRATRAPAAKAPAAEAATEKPARKPRRSTPRQTSE